MSAITQRGKRKTAGRRMTALVGKAQEEDDTFWGHDTWAEGADSGNESFRDSDEDSALKKDEFDSDFDDSESDHEEEEKAAGEAEERQLKRQERSKGKGRGYTEVTRRRPIKGGGKRVVGDGMNAGILLNFPPSAGGTPLPTPGAAPLQPFPAATVAKAPPKKKRITMATTRERRSQTVNKRLRESTKAASAQPPPPSRKISKTGGNRRSGKRVYEQEELLLEAVHKTEPENDRWLLARKRIKDVEDQDREAMALRDKNKGPVIQKYHSKRGCLKTLTFPEMDSVPEILTRQKVVLKQPKKSFCVITGKPARYKDPKTNLGYFDLAAFKELRRRMEAKEPLDQRKREAQKVVKPPSTTPAAEPKTIKAPKPTTTKPSTKPTTTKSATDGTSPADVTPMTPKANGGANAPNSAANGPLLPQLSPSGRRISPRSWKPSEKMRENIVSNPQMNNLVKLGLSSPTKASSTIPGSPATGINGKTSSILPAVKSSIPANGAVNSVKSNGTTSAPPKPTSKQPKRAASREKRTSPPSKKPKSTGTTKTIGKKQPEKVTSTAAGATTGTPRAKAPSEQKQTMDTEKVYVAPNTKQQTSKDKKYLSQSQLIMQVIQDYNKQHPDAKE